MEHSSLFTNYKPGRKIPTGLKHTAELLFHNVGGSRSFGPINDFKLNLIALI